MLIQDDICHFAPCVQPHRPLDAVMMSVLLQYVMMDVTLHLDKEGKL